MQIKNQVEKYIDIYSTDETQARAMKIGLVFTGIIWFILLIILAVSPGWQQKKKYKTVRIILEPPVERISDNKVAAAAAAQAPAPVSETKAEPKSSAKADSAPAAPVKQVESQKQANLPKKTEAAKPVTEAKKANIKYGKSVDELMNAQVSKTSSKSVDWDSMDWSENSSSNSTSSVSNAKAVNNDSALSGTAATKTNASGGVSTNNQKVSAGLNATSSTSSSLSSIANQKYSMSAANGITSQVSAGISANSDGKLSLAMTDGSSRILLDPKKPYIEISDENAKLIDSTRNVVITFRILAAGNVPLNEIIITPSSALPVRVQSEIKEQISKWRFAAASSDGQARFDYSIIKK